MPRGTRRTYARDGRGRFASTGTTTAKAKPAARRAQRGTNRIARDNSGKITGVGKDGATARGGRLRTAAGNQRGAVLDRMKKRQSSSGAIKRSDINKARIHNTVSKMAEKRNKSGLNNPVRKIEDSAARLKAASKRIAGQDRARPVAVAARPVPGGRKARVDDGRVSRVIGRLNNVVRAAEDKTGVKRLNAIQAGVRAKSFLARKERGSVGMLNQMSQPEAFASVRKAMTKPPRYSTQKPNRNKPGRFNDLGQDKARVKARRDAMTTRDKIQEVNKLAAVKAKAQKSNLSKAAIRGGALSRRELGYSSSLRNGFARAPRIRGTIPKPKKEPRVSLTVARTRSQAKAAQRNRREQILNNTRFSRTGVWQMKRNPRIRAVDTRMSQLSLMDKPKKLKRYKPVK